VPRLALDLLFERLRVTDQLVGDAAQLHLVDGDPDVLHAGEDAHEG